jgi:hypothetical protein
MCLKAPELGLDLRRCACTASFDITIKNREERWIIGWNDDAYA